jgi:hypothetical protein
MKANAKVNAEGEAARKKRQWVPEMKEGAETRDMEEERNTPPAVALRCFRGPALMNTWFPEAAMWIVASATVVARESCGSRVSIRNKEDVSVGRDSTHLGSPVHGVRDGSADVVVVVRLANNPPLLTQREVEAHAFIVSGF